MAAETLVSAANIFKKLWPQKRIDEMVFKEFPVLGLAKKIDDFGGDGDLYLALQRGNQQGVASTLATAQANQTANAYTRFRLSRTQLYGSGKVEGPLIRASKIQAGRLVDAYDRAMGGLLETFNQRLAGLLWGEGGGAMGRIKAGASLITTSLELADPTQTVNFEVGQILRVSSGNGTAGVLRAGSVTITAVNRRTGVLTLNVALNVGVPTVAAQDYVFHDGIFHATTPVISGVPAWVPTTDPTPTLFKDVDRTVDPTRLAGLRYSEIGSPIEIAIQNAYGFARREGVKPDTLFMNPEDLQKLLSSLDAKRASYTRVERGGMGVEVGYKGVEIITSIASVTVIPDPWVPVGYGWALDMATWELHTMGPFPHVIGEGEDGLMLARHATEDAYEWRLFAAGDLGCTAPGKNMCIQF